MRLAPNSTMLLSLQRANVFALALNAVQHVLFFVYPPRTWVVPFYGVGGKDKDKKQ